MSICSFEGCSGSIGAAGLCMMHYRRRLKGQPMDAPSRNVFAAAAQMEWLTAMVSFDGDECLPWPFHRTAGNGYARLGNRSAAKIMCEQAHGPAPEGKPFTRHLCGKGHEACVNSRHLTWGNRSENEIDKIKDGTSNHGSGNGRAKLTVEDVLYIRSQPKTVRNAFLARKYGVSQKTLGQARCGETWQLDRGSPIPAR